MRISYVGRWAIMLMAAQLGATPGFAQSFEEALSAARRNDPIYAQRQAEVQLTRLQARQAKLAYIPAATVGYSESDFNQSARDISVGVSQPLFDYDRFLQVRQARPLEQKADASAIEVEQDLAQRVFRSMAQLVLNRETRRALDVQIESLEAQTRRAIRMRELGQGTVTEVSDFEVRLATARANALTTTNNLRSAERAFVLLTGLEPQTAEVNLDPLLPPAMLPTLEDFRREVATGNTTLEQARRDLELAELNLRRARAEFWPKISGFASYAKTEGFPGESDSRIGVSLAVPLDANYFFSNSRASVELRRTRDIARFTEAFILTELERLYATVTSLQGETVIRERAIANARLAVEGNLKGYEGGIKSNIDVVTSIQNLTDAEVALVTSKLALASSYLDLSLLGGATR